MRIAFVLASGVLALASQAMAQPGAVNPPAAVNPIAAEAWGPAPPGLPAGAQTMVVSGDPTKAGPFVIRAKMPAGYKIPPHWHPADENVMVVSGDLTLGMGDKLDAAKGTKLTAGKSIVDKAKMHHFAMTEGGAVVQISTEGPFEITYINPADDPRAKPAP